METTFKLFNPQTMKASDLPDCPGNYLVVLANESSRLPDVGIEPVYTKTEHNGMYYDVIYTGISTDSLRKRDYKQHFTGNNAGVSTLRKSLGSLMGMKKIPRDAGKPENGKTKFSENDEICLSNWMKKNLLLLYRAAWGVNAETLIKEDEKRFILEYNPPLNIQHNMNEVNREYRNLLKQLRK